ncbi:MAG: hypothetical protein RL536_499 [Candidatus Parcubacteria bacterium]|jgi:alanyl-tRNA synthetase
MDSSEIRSRFLKFFEKRGHTIIPSASLVTTDEKGTVNSTLFNTAGMQPLVPFLLGKEYFVNGQQTKRLVDSQKCLRTIDIDDVGDKTHATFFEMLGNWSLGDYFKEDAIKWSYEFLTSKSDRLGDQGLGLDPKRLYITVFAGDQNAKRDDESAEIWESVGVLKHRIYFKDASANWWPAVKSNKEDNWTGPTGPCSEMFYDITSEGLGDLTPVQFEQADNDQRVVEIWNDVFMEFEKQEGKIIATLAKKNVDTGAGLERLATVLQKVDNIYDTDLFKPVMSLMDRADNSIRNKRIIADHLRASIFLIADGVLPSNTNRGYILRRLIRRGIISTTDKKLNGEGINLTVDSFLKIYADSYPELLVKRDQIVKVLIDEASKFEETLAHGMHEFNNLVKSGKISGADAFKLFSSFGLPIDVTNELANSKNISVDMDGYEAEFRKHQELSRVGAEQKFKGGLGDANDPMVLRYHTATHLLHQALHDVLGENEGNQKGSNITAERLRFDFTGAKLTDEQKKCVEDIVNEKISQSLPMSNIVLPRAEAEKTGARHFFGEKYGEDISIYFIGPVSNPPALDDLKKAYSKEFCGGPHVGNTVELAGPEGKWRFKIQKEEAVSQGVRRIKAVLQ